jgi:DNA-binding LacI/PurR family transcriptional regulator
VQPPLTTIRQPLAAMADAAVEALVHRLEGKDLPDDKAHVSATPELVVRASTAPPRRASEAGAAQRE